MKCMRCGTEIAAEAVFCKECLADMQKHPVKPDTPITLPNRETNQPPKRSKKRVRKPEDQITALRRLVIWLMAAVILLVIALTAAVYLLVEISGNANPIQLPGQNYHTSQNEK